MQSGILIEFQRFDAMLLTLERHETCRSLRQRQFAQGMFDVDEFGGERFKKTRRNLQFPFRETDRPLGFSM